MTGVSAGVFRSSANVVSASRAEDPRFSSVGTNLANGLDRAKWQHVGTNTGFPRSAVLRPNHVVASALNEIVAKKPPQPEPNCCRRKTFYWDDAIVYAPQVHWSDAPASVFWDGPVYRAIPALESVINQQAAP